MYVSQVNLSLLPQCVVSTGLDFRPHSEEERACTLYEHACLFACVLVSHGINLVFRR